MTDPIAGPILLPSNPGLQTDGVTMLDWGGPLSPVNGGAVQTLMRLGTRHALEFTIPTMPTEPLGRQWAALLRLAKLYGALLPFGQDGFKVGAPGAPVVAGAGQSGSLLAIRGFTTGYAAKIGQAFSIVHGGRRYLHFVATQGLSVDGTLTLAIFPMLRIIPADGDVCEFARPMIQGSLSGQPPKWSRQTAPWSDFGTITISEDE
ncbi:hypothetical protein [Sphingomonas bacterium]|uniref:hypothetical protein n=1 Tax=Sphingomonas bacterium TaxID=1895847 RepID=UPI0015777267|nr:hypothetical protein [Sphingomonas bacterium]